MALFLPTHLHNFSRPFAHVPFYRKQYLRNLKQIEWLTGIRRISFIPIIILSDTPEQDLHPMIEIGADICVSSGNSYPAIADFAHAQLRRYTEYNHYNDPRRLEGSPFQVGNIYIDPSRREVTVQGHKINLRRREFSLLLYFMRNPNIVLSSVQICENAWGMAGSYTQGVSHPIRLLRQAIEPDPKQPMYIQTEHRFGYRFTPNCVETCDKC